MPHRRQPKTRLRIFGEYCCAWPVWGEDSEDVEAMVSPALRKDLLDWQQFRHHHQGVDDWDTPEAAVGVRESRSWDRLRRLQRELDRPVEFL